MIKTTFLHVILDRTLKKLVRNKRPNTHTNWLPLTKQRCTVTLGGIVWEGDECTVEVGVQNFLPAPHSAYLTDDSLPINAVAATLILPKFM